MSTTKKHNKKYDFPIKYFEGNLFFNENTKDCWAIYQMVGVSYEFLSTDNKILLHQRLSRFMANLGEQAKLFVIPVAQDYEAIYDQLIDNISQDDEMYEISKNHGMIVKNYLKGKLEAGGNTNDYDCYICVKLNRVKSNASLGEAIKEPARAINEYLTTDSIDIRERELRLFHESSKRFEYDQTKRMRLIPIEVDTAQWLIRRMFLRGTGKKVDLRRNLDGSPWKPQAIKYKKDGNQFLRPFQKDVLTLGNEVVEHKKFKDYVKVMNSDGTESYQCFLPFSHIPDGIELIGGEWLFLLQDLSVTSEVCITIKTIDYQNAIKKIGRNYDEVNGQMKHVEESGVEMPEELVEAKLTTEEIKGEIKSYKDPLLEVGVTICIANSDLETMKYDVDRIRTTYKDLEFRIEKPFTDQLDYFFEFIPGGPILCKDYAMLLPPRTIAGSMFPVKRRLGDNEGHYIGTMGAMAKMVFLSLARACRVNQSASAVFLGTLGGGKSFNANLLLYLSIMSGGSGLIIDPKGERGNWEEDLPELKGNIHTISLTPTEADRGKLDPFIIYRENPDEAAALASSMMIDWLQIVSNTDEDTALAEAINTVKNMDYPSMLKVINVLDSFDPNDELYKAARRLARKITNKQDIGMTKLIFGRGDEKGLSFDKRVNILQIQNIKLPESSKNKEDYSDEERLSTVLMIPISSFAKKFVQRKTDKFKVVLLDESWALKTTSMGKDLYEYLARTGRSQNAAAIFIGHSVKDVDEEGIKESLTFKFIFKVKTDEEARRACELLDIEPTDFALDTLKTLPNGVCLFRDMDGNVDELHWDAVFVHLIERAFNTNPTQQRKAG